MSEIVTYAKAEFFRKPNLSESRMYRIPKFRSVDWTHDMIIVKLIVKWHLLIWHKRKLCALTNRPPAQSTRTGQWLSTLFHANCSAAQVYVLHPCQLFFALGCRRRSVLPVFLSSYHQEGYFKKIFCVCYDDKLYGENMSKPRNNKNFEFDWGKKFKITHVRDRNLTEDRICPKAEFFRKPNLSENRMYRIPKFRIVDWTHVMIIVKWHLLIWHKRNCALWQIGHRLNAHERVNDYQRYSMLIVLPLRSMSCTLGNSSLL